MDFKPIWWFVRAIPMRGMFRGASEHFRIVTLKFASVLLEDLETLFLLHIVTLPS